MPLDDDIRLCNCWAIRLFYLKRIASIVKFGQIYVIKLMCQKMNK